MTLNVLFILLLTIFITLLLLHLNQRFVFERLYTFTVVYLAFKVSEHYSWYWVVSAVVCAFLLEYGVNRMLEGYSAERNR